jgi:hypothetical protein
MSLAPVRPSPWYFVPLRALVITVIITLLSFAVSLLLGIIGMAIVAAFQGVPPNMALAYRHVAFPVAVVAAAFGLVISLTMEIRQYRRTRALGKMEEQFGRAS